MVNSLKYIKSHLERTKQIIGINYQQWSGLVELAKVEEERLKFEYEHQKVRINKKGGGTPKILSPEEEVCLCLTKDMS